MPLLRHHSRRVLPVVTHSQISSALSCGTGSGGLPLGRFSVFAVIDDLFPSIRGLCSSFVLANFFDGAEWDVEDLGQFAVAHFLVFVHVTDFVYDLIREAGIVVGRPDSVSLLIDSHEMHALFSLHLIPSGTAYRFGGFLPLSLP